MFQVTAMAPLVPARPLQDQPEGALLGKSTNAPFVKHGTLNRRFCRTKCGAIV
jgi:hypothetical protein